MNRNWRPPAAVWIALLLGLGAYLAVGSVDYYPSHWSMDLYHPWGIPLALKALGAGTNPYADTAQYGAYLDAMARASPSKALHWVREFWEWRNPFGIEPTGTPLYYAAQAFLPADFDRAHLALTLVDFAAAGASVFLIARLRGANMLPALCLVAFVLGNYNPFIQDVRVGNVNSVQLLALVAMIGAAQMRLYERYGAVDRLYLAALALLVVFKPNVVFIAAALAAHYAVARGARRFAAGAAIAALAAFAGAAYAAWYFGSADVWWAWLRYTQGMNGGTLVYALVKGNTALPVMLSERSGAYGPTGYAALLALAFAVALVACASSLGRQPERAAAALRRWLADPWCAASVAALFMFATSPLLWPHYFMFALIPMAWLMRPERPGDIGPACAVVSYLLFSRLALGPLVLADLGRLAYSVMFFSWVPLLPAAFSRLARQAAAPPTPQPA